MAILSLFALFSVGFWVLTALTIIFLIWALEQNESPGWATTVLIAFGVLFFLAGGKVTLLGLLATIIAHPALVVLYVLLYLILGSLWSFFKWYILLLKIKSVHEKNVISHEKNGYTIPILYRPQASENKDKIIAWMMYWPFSALWFLINKPILRMFTSIYEQLSGIYDKMAVKVLGPESKER